MLLLTHTLALITLVSAVLCLITYMEGLSYDLYNKRRLANKEYNISFYFFLGMIVSAIVSLVCYHGFVL